MRPLMDRESIYLNTRELSIFTPEEISRKKVLVQTDQSGAEALIVAYLAPKGRYRLLFENNIKVHCYVALHLFKRVWEKELGRSIDNFLNAEISKLTQVEGWKELDKIIKSSDDWIPSRRYYYIAKMVCHASNYGIKAPTFVMHVLKKSEGTIILTNAEAELFLGLYHSMFPEIRIWHLMVMEQLKKDRTLFNLFGDRRVFNGQEDDNYFKAAYAFVPQSTVGMLTNIAITEIQEQIDERNPEYAEIDILANGHDSILSQTQIGLESKLAKIQEMHLGKVFFQGTENEFKMKSESNWGFNGYELRGFK